jgi:hypothetical protein
MVASVEHALYGIQSPIMASAKRYDLIHRLLAGQCEHCESTDRLEVHHLRKLADLNLHDRPDKPAWVHLMAKRRRKTLVICRTCHEGIHAGGPLHSASGLKKQMAALAHRGPHSTRSRSHGSPGTPKGCRANPSGHGCAAVHSSTLI